MIYEVTNIEYDTEDTDDTSGLPLSLKIEVDESLDDYDKIEFISDEISNITGFCHKGFSTDPSIDENS